MYEELQQKKPPRVPKSIRAKGLRGLLGIVSPSKLLYRSYALDQTEEEKKYFCEEWKYRLYKRRVSRDEWRRIYREHRKAQHPEQAQEWERKQQEAAQEEAQAIRTLLGEIDKERERLWQSLV